MTIKIPQLSNLRQIYKDHGYDVRFVGGCVRDDLLGVPTNDYDLASPMPATEALNALHNAGFKVIPTGLAHGTITVIIDSAPYEITTLRKDISTDGRRATVEATDNWEEDAHRRDFTINALYQDFDGTLYDYTKGQDDLNHGIVRFIGNPEDRIQEDYLRILRYFRFAQRYAKHDLPDDLQAIFKKYAAKIQNLSKERITQEFLKILESATASKTLKEMQACSILDQIIPKNDLSRLETLEDTCKQLDIPPSVLRNLVALSSTDTCLRLSNDQKSYIKHLDKILSDLSKDRLYHALFNEGKQRTLDAILISGDINLYDTCIKIGYAPLPITSQDVINLGIPPGPQLGKALSSANDFWCNQKFLCTKEEIFKHITSTFLQ